MFMIEKLEATENNEKENNSVVEIKSLGFPSNIVIFFKIRSEVCVSPLYAV